MPTNASTVGSQKDLFDWPYKIIRLFISILSFILFTKDFHMRHWSQNQELLTLTHRFRLSDALLLCTILYSPYSLAHPDTWKSLCIWLLMSQRGSIWSTSQTSFFKSQVPVAYRFAISLRIISSSDRLQNITSIKSAKATMSPFLDTSSSFLDDKL